MDRSQLIIFSLIGDVLDFLVIGQAPIISWVIDIPVVLMHVYFAGPKGFFTIVELIPVVGTLPVFTASALIQKPK